MDGSLPNLRQHLAGLLAGVIGLVEFQRWFWENSTAIEQAGGDEDVDLLLLVLNRLAEYTSDYIDAAELLHALRTDLSCSKSSRRIALPKPKPVATAVVSLGVAGACAHPRVYATLIASIRSCAGVAPEGIGTIGVPGGRAGRSTSRCCRYGRRA